MRRVKSRDRDHAVLRDGNHVALRNIEMSMTKTDEFRLRFGFDVCDLVVLWSLPAVSVGRDYSD